MKYKILITGGLGYLGGRLCYSLSEKGNDIICATRRLNINPPKELFDIKFLTVDWDRLDEISHACSGVDCIIHLAGLNEIESANNPVAALNTNAVISLSLLEVAKRLGVKRFIYFSTAHVYGAPLKGKINELTTPMPAHPYSITHRVVEDFILLAHKNKQIEGIVLRLSNGFGVPLTRDINRWTLLVNNLCYQAVSTGQLELNTDGSQLRDFITISDIANAVSHLISCDKDKLSDGLFNLGSEKTLSILEMTNLVAERWRLYSGKPIKIVRPSQKNTLVGEFKYVCEKIKKTGFILTNNFNQEIDDTIKFCGANFSKLETK